MCTCHHNEAGELIVCDFCASAQIEAHNALAFGQVELVPGTLARQECEDLASAVDNFFALLQSRGGCQ